MQDTIPEEASPRGVLRKSDNDFSLVKENSGHRSSPRGSPTRLVGTADTSPSSDKAENHHTHLAVSGHGGGDVSVQYPVPVIIKCF